MMMAFASFSYGSIATSVPVTCDLTAVGCEIADSVALLYGAVVFRLHTSRIFRAENPYLVAFVHEDVSEGQPQHPLGGNRVIKE